VVYKLVLGQFFPEHLQFSPDIHHSIFPRQVKTLYKQQTSHNKNNTQTNLDLWNTALGYGFHFQHRNCFQSKALRVIVDAPFYVPNTAVRSDLQIPTIKEEIRHCSQYSARLSAHRNDVIVL
jgi:hypothetical protein